MSKLVLHCCGDSFECDSIQHVLNIIRLVKGDYSDVGGPKFRLNGRELEVSTAQKTFGNITKILNESPITSAIEKMKQKGLQYELTN